MNRLFVELYFDEDVDILVADLMRARGLAVKTTREEGRLHDNNEAQPDKLRVLQLETV